MDIKNHSQITIGIVPRERFSLMLNCIEQIYQQTPEPFQMIVVDANAPQQIAERLREWETTHANCQVIRSKRFLYPYEAKNLIVERLATDWIAFVDSDVMVGPHWMAHLLAAARETGARIVHPLYLVEQEKKVRIHMTDGKLKRVQKNGKELFHLIMGHVAQEVKETRGLQRQESDFLEFHGFLIHRNVLKKMGPFDPFTLAEDAHYSLKLREFKERIIFEPRAVITYVAGPPFERYDMPYFRFRWDLKRARTSAEQLRQRWPLTDEYCESKFSWVAYHHSRVSPWFSLARRWRRWSGQMRSRLVSQAKRLVTREIT